MQGTLNFYDDKTHVRTYSLKALTELLQETQCKILKSGTRRDLRFIAIMPLYILTDMIRYRHLRGGIMWDFLGFANYLIAQKK